ncbi:site-specific tyrosine recombinase XerC [Azoarcus sp. Aa7]|nr:site-specific tyrosine recombinase XerC [Azoarcus sp. Aa7]
MATFRKRGNSWRVEICIDGLRESATFDSKGAGQAWADKRSTELRQAQIVQTTNELGQKTLGELLQEIVNERLPLSRTRRTQEAAEHRIERMKKRSICDKQVRLLTISDFKAYVDDRKKEGVVASTIRRELGVVRAAFNRLIAKGQLDYNPVQPVLKSQPRDRLVSNLLSDAQFRRMEIAHEELNSKRTKNPWLFWAFRLAAETGLRKAEMLGLEWDDIDLESRIAMIRRVDDLPSEDGERTTEGLKNGDPERQIALTPEAVEILLHMPRAIDPTLRERVIPTSYNALSCAFERLRRRAGLQRFRWHDLRHMAATALLSRLGNVAEVAVVTGHKDWKSLARYTHPQAAAVAQKLARS